MEEAFDFQIDFETISSMPVVLEDTASQQHTHPLKETADSPKKGFTCNVPGCGKSFKFKSEFARHNVIHQNDRPHCCTYQGCTKTFKRVNALENHLRTHHAEAFSELSKKSTAKTVNNNKPQEGCYKKFKKNPESPENFPWELRSEKSDKESLDEVSSETFKQMLDKLIEENRVLKNKLHEYKSIIYSSEDKQSIGSHSDHQYPYSEEFMSSPDGTVWL